MCPENEDRAESFNGDQVIFVNTELIQRAVAGLQRSREEFQALLDQAELGDLYAISGSGGLVPAEEYVMEGETTAPATPADTQVTVRGDSYVFQGAGNGHQLGMSQYGAWAMAERGFSYDEIVEFYYPGTEVR